VTDPTLLSANGAAPDPEPAPRGDEPPEVLALWAAVEQGDVSFHHVSTAWFESRQWNETSNGNGGPPDDARRRAYARVFPVLLDKFGARHGSLVGSYFGRNIRVGAALTDHAEDTERPESRTEPPANTAIHLEPVFGDADSPRAKELLSRSLRVQYQALEFLKPKPRKICMRMAFNVITMILGTLDSRTDHGKHEAFDHNPDDQRTIEKELECTEAYFVQSAQRTARLEYLIGMIPGLLLAALATSLMWFLDLVPRDLSIAFIGGALGALVSVMSRLTSGKLTLNHEYGKATLRILGGMRPFVGALFGGALYVLIAGALIPMEVPGNPDEQRFFFAGLGFLAGFSERWAQDMIDPGKLPTTTVATTAAAHVQARPTPVPLR
jgi:hypothetical protein